ncbi:MAG TPA: copper resistance system multicopper oxidase [Steroidobacteraceae bacterium]|nr:copper resistance system multicopper oxidase [Steroidobacteraceae bacterium]
MTLERPLLPSSISRRRFVQGVVGGAALLAAGRGSSADTLAGPDSPVLTGPEFDLTIAEIAVDYTGRKRMATAVNGRVPGPLLRMRQGDTVTLRVTNRLRVRSSIHWHGLLLPADMDGVPGLSFAGIEPGSTFVYRFTVGQSGTYWYHSHSRFQEQTGLYGPIVIEPRDLERQRSEREHVVLLSDWSDADPEWLYATLKRQSDYFNFGKRTFADLLADARARGMAETLADRSMWGRMRMDPTDLADVGGAAYTYLLNGLTPAENWTGVFRRGERVRLRFINGSAMSFFDVRIPGLAMTVVAADGQEVEPVTVEEFRLGTAEVLDVIVAPSIEQAYTIFAQSMDRSGYARGTLAPRPGMTGELPPLEPRALLTMHDVGMHPMAGESGQHASAEAADFGAGVDMVAAHTAPRLDDPGPGLRGNGRRVLTYADLHTRGGPLDPREPGREIELHLTGHMERFMWSFNGQKFSEAPPLEFALAERLRIVLVNDSMMTHPIHLHGMWSEVEGEAGEFLVRKHTVSVQPAQRLTYLVTASARGRWAYHCHLLYHMEAGMFREVVVGSAARGAGGGGA